MSTRRQAKNDSAPTGRTWLLLLVPLLALVASLTLSYLWNEDFWWYLSSGRAILENGGIPDRDPFLYTSDDGIGWVYHSWLWTVLVALLERLGGLETVVVFHTLMAAAIVALLYTSARVDRLGLANAFAGLLFVVIVRHRLCGKTELATWLLVVIFYRLLEMRGAFTWKRGAVLGGLQILWANLHGGYPLGIFMALCYSAGGWLQQRVGGTRRPSGRRAPQDSPPTSGTPPLWFPVLLFLLAIADPRLFTERLAPFGFVTGSRTVQPIGASGNVLILEWQSPFTDPMLTWHFLIAAAAGLASFVVARRWHLPRLLLLLGTIGLGMSAIRHLSVLALVSALILLSNLAERRPRRFFRLPRLYPVASGLTAAFLLASAVSLRLARPGFEAVQPESFFTVKPALACPRAAEFILEQGLPGPIFNDYPLGAYLGARLHPIHRVFIDSRVLDPSVVVDYTAMVDSERSWRKAEARYGFRTAILGNYSKTVRSALGSALLRDRDWRLVYVDPLAVIFVEREAAPRSLEPHLPARADRRRQVPFADPPQYGRWAAALQRIFLNDAPSNYLIEYLAILGHLGQTREVYDLASRALETMPDHPLLYRQRCAANFVRGNLQAAVSDCERAYELRPEDPQVVILYCSVLERAGNRAQSGRIAAEALRRDPENRQLQALRQRLNS